jgi:hypothetical protein
MRPATVLHLTSHSLAFLAAAGIVAFSVAGRADGNNRDELRQKAAALREVSLVRWSLPKDGRASAVTLTIKNQNNFSIKEITVTCSQATTAGKVISETRTIAEPIKANSSRVVALPKASLRLSAGAMVACNIDDLQIAAQQRLASAAPAK